MEEDSSGQRVKVQRDITNLKWNHFRKTAVGMLENAAGEEVHDPVVKSLVSSSSQAYWDTIERY